MKTFQASTWGGWVFCWFSSMHNMSHSFHMVGKPLTQRFAVIFFAASTGTVHCQIAICVVHLQRTFVDEGWFSVMVASQHVLMWTKLHYFAKVFNPTKNTIVDTIRIGDDVSVVNRTARHCLHACMQTLKVLAVALSA